MTTQQPGGLLYLRCCTSTRRTGATDYHQWPHHLSVYIAPGKRKRAALKRTTCWVLDEDEVTDRATSGAVATRSHHRQIVELVKVQ